MFSKVIGEQQSKDIKLLYEAESFSKFPGVQ